jgi:uncharacterized protein
MPELLKQPWPWYAGGIIIGLTVPALLILGNKHFGISANLRHTCAACFPSNIKFFRYDWKKEVWNLFFAVGIMIGALLAAKFFTTPASVNIDAGLANELDVYGITDHSGLLPVQLFNIESLFSARGLIMMVGGGFLVGFGTRYAGGCTSGHAIMGISHFQVPSMIATISFMVGGFLMANLILPLIMKL